jgi:ADP-heptose:LPS heptosyltransferase
MSQRPLPGLLFRLPRRPRKVVLVRASRIGDFVCATPALKALRNALPGTEISLIGLPIVRDLAVRSLCLDRFIPFPGFPGMAEQLFDPRRSLAFFREMQEEGFDLAIQMHGSGVYSNPFTLMLGARLTAGFVRPGEGAGRLDAALPYPANLHEIRKLLRLTEFLGAGSICEETECPLFPEDHNEAEKLLAGVTRPLIGVQPGARAAIKTWTPERFAAAASELQRYYGGTVVILGGPGEEKVAQAVREKLKAPAVVLCGKTQNLGALGAVIQRLAVLLTNDTGPAHFAYALGTPSVTVFGGTRPSEWAALNEDRHAALAFDVTCRPCEYSACPIGNVCLAGVSAAEVVGAARRVLEKPFRLAGQPTPAGKRPSASGEPLPVIIEPLSAAS